jgi:hypothetical protein
MGWGNACEVYHKEIAHIADIKDIDGKEGILLKLLNDMECLAKMYRRFMSVYRGHGMLASSSILSFLTEQSTNRLWPKHDRGNVGASKSQVSPLHSNVN